MKPAAGAAALLLLPLWPAAAWAHGSIPGANQFYIGFLHPLLAPAHLLALVALGLALGIGGEGRKAWTVQALAAGLVAGGLLSLPLGDPNTDALLFALAVLLSLLIAFQRLGPRGTLATLALLVGLAVGLGSGDPVFTTAQRFIAVGGSVVGALIVAGQVGFWVEMLVKHAPQQGARIGVRIVSAWLVAITTLLLAMTLFTANRAA